jgi:hypothetical protein
MRASRALALVVVVVALASAGCRKKKVDPKRELRTQLLAELQPVALSNCKLERFGSQNDGGYIMCGDLVEGVQAAYSYGIEHEDNWGCQLARQTKLPIHQYDCFTADRPTCDGGVFDFHSECIGPKAETIEGRPYDTLAAQIEKNGDKGKRLIIKMDVEGAEWDSIMATSDEVLANVDQFVFEMHGVNEQKFIDVVKKLKKTFHIVWLHYNNYECTKKARPMLGNVYEVTFVNKRLGKLDPSGKPHVAGAAPDMPNNPNAKDCQTP